MNKIKMAFVMPCVLFSGMAFSQQAMKLSPERAIAGDSVTISYNPENTRLKGQAPVSGVIYLYNNNQWEAHDLQMKMTDSGWVTRYYLPEKTALLVCNFSANGITDKGGTLTYATMLSTRDGRQMATAYAAWAFLRTPSFIGEVPPAVDDTVKITNEVAMFWMNNELRYHPESRRLIFYNAMKILKSTGEKRADTIIRREINYISSLKDVTEAELMDVSKAYRNLLGDRNRADSMNNVIIARFPSGVAARDAMVFKMFKGPAGGRYPIWQEFVKKFPPQQFEGVNTEIQQMYYNKAFRSVVYEKVMAGKNLQYLDEIMDVAPFEALTEFHRLLIMNALAHDEIKLADAFPYSKKLVERIEAYATNRSDAASRFYSPLQWKEQVLKFALPAFMGHASLLHKQGDDKAALQWMEKVKEQPGAERADFLSLYATLLENTGRHADAMQIAENATRSNKATPEIIALLKQEYVRKHKKETGFDAYFEGMKSADVLSVEQEALRAQLIRKQAPGFKLEQLTGGVADLAKMKGKIVVLDFWATWCGPCKEAMPGMQMAADKYSKDKNVNFFFIATQETKPDYRDQIKKFLQSKNLHLNVLLDAKSSTSGHLDDTYNKYAQTLSFSGIPAKAIIDQHGMIRWLGIGYKGSPSALADEISYIIELLKKEG
ncbi:Thiol-disulfide isomerase or thioredoxin [Chitinophaga ginsengisegetis]|uniref:Thiol-disulfide isomerase or thioredoxin n=1 Tax=Chitinophaga ginsengisegetis TaxID=393003 RepID=A0A1T5P956_9BACT|nr:TlpA disulfide reductase family protein [Chitinophaga ginsengisegetis]SKD09295.1 Thiol-disulfide isomerase or thioredoxin [Chitinophaga ginsengisegetis]